MWHNSVMTRRPRKCFDDIGDRFDRSLAYEEIGFTDKPFNFSVVLVEWKNPRKRRKMVNP